jgi:hypothetical protein
MQSWTESHDLENEVHFDELLARGARAIARWIRDEMGIRVRWGFCLQVAAVVFIAVFLLWLGEALPAAVARVG